MRAGVALVAAVLSLALTLCPAACALAQAASPFPDVPVPQPAPRRHLGAYAALVSGAALIGLSYTFDDVADRRYADYLEATEPARIRELYDRARTYDGLSSASLIGGEVLLATGLYLRFLRRPLPAHATLTLGPARCALAWRF